MQRWAWQAGIGVAWLGVARPGKVPQGMAPQALHGGVRPGAVGVVRQERNGLSRWRLVWLGAAGNVWLGGVRRGSDRWGAAGKSKEEPECEYSQ